MNPAKTRKGASVIYVGALAAVGLLWWRTALEDSEWALWHRYDAGTVMANVAVSVVILSISYLLCTKDDLIPRVGRLVFIVGGGVFALALLELPALLGVLDYGVLFASRENSTWLQLAMGVNRHDPELIHIHKGHTRYRGIVQGNLNRLGIPTALYQVDVAYDKNGFRNDQDFTRADVAAIGDSFVEGAEVSQGQTMVAQLRRELGVDVVNLGQASYGPQQELIVLKRYALPLRPKAVIWFLFGGNDLADAEAYEWNRSHPDALLAPPPYAARSFSRNALRALSAATTPRRRTPSPAGRLYEAEFIRRDGSKETQYLDDMEGAWTPRQWDMTTAAVAGAQAAAQQSGSDFLVVYIPRKLRVYRGFLRAEPGAHALTWKDNNLPDVLSAWCRDNGIAFLDSTLALRSAVAAGESVHLPDDVHWSPAGHRVVAAAVAQRLREMGSLQAHSPYDGE